MVKRISILDVPEPRRWVSWTARRSGGTCFLWQFLDALYTEGQGLVNALLTKETEHKGVSLWARFAYLTATMKNIGVEGKHIAAL